METIQWKDALMANEPLNLMALSESLEVSPMISEQSLPVQQELMEQICGTETIKEKQAQVLKMKKRIETLERQVQATSMECDRLEHEMATKRKARKDR